MKKYYEAYDERYRIVHARGVSWTSDTPSPIVLQTIRKYGFGRNAKMLEIGCGEGRDALAVLREGFDLLAVDLSEEAISFCQKRDPDHAQRFAAVNCIGGTLDQRFDFIYAVAVVHMLVEDEDRDAFYGFIRNHLTHGGLALVCSMGDGERELKTDPREAFELRQREHVSGRMMVPATTCRMITFPGFIEEIERSGLRIKEKGLTQSPPEFDSLMYAVLEN